MKKKSELTHKLSTGMFSSILLSVFFIFLSSCSVSYLTMDNVPVRAHFQKTERGDSLRIGLLGFTGFSMSQDQTLNGELKNTSSAMEALNTMSWEDATKGEIIKAVNTVFSAHGPDNYVEGGEIFPALYDAGLLPKIPELYQSMTRFYRDPMLKFGIPALDGEGVDRELIREICSAADMDAVILGTYALYGSLYDNTYKVETGGSFIIFDANGETLYYSPFVKKLNVTVNARASIKWIAPINMQLQIMDAAYDLIPMIKKAGHFTSEGEMVITTNPNAPFIVPNFEKNVYHIAYPQHTLNAESQSAPIDRIEILFGSEDGSDFIVPEKVEDNSWKTPYRPDAFIRIMFETKGRIYHVFNPSSGK